MIQPHDRREVSRPAGRNAPWRRVGSVMIVTANVAVISLVMRRCVGAATDASLYAVWAPLAIVLGVAASWTGRGLLEWATRPDPRGQFRACGRCGRHALRTLVRAQPGRVPTWAGARCSHCGTTYRRVDGRIVPVPTAPAAGPTDDPGIRFEDQARADEVRFLDDPPG